MRALAEKSTKGCRQGSGTYSRGTCLACDLRTGKPDRRASFSFNKLNGWYKCFKCGVVGRLGGFEATDFEMSPEADGPGDFEPPQSFYELCRGEGVGAQSLEPAREYLRSRGLTDEKLWKQAHLGACVGGYYQGRVVVPILSPDGVWVGFVARIWTKKGDKPYLYPKGMNRSETLYNHAALLVKTEVPVFVVEGVMDALALWPNAVATLGSPSGDQVNALIDCPRPVAVCNDGDAWEAGEALAMALRLDGQTAGSIKLPPRKDPDEMPKDWLYEEALACLG